MGAYILFFPKKAFSETKFFRNPAVSRAFGTSRAAAARLEKLAKFGEFTGGLVALSSGFDAVQAYRRGGNTGAFISGVDASFGAAGLFPSPVAGAAAAGYGATRFALSFDIVTNNWVWRLPVDYLCAHSGDCG